MVKVEYNHVPISDIAAFKSKTVIIDPAYQYIQMPYADAHILFTYMKKVYPDLDCTITQYSSCVFEEECDDVAWVQQAPFLIQLADSSSTPLEIDVRKLFISSAELNPKLKNQYCHFTVTNDAPGD